MSSFDFRDEYFKLVTNGRLTKKEQSIVQKAGDLLMNLKKSLQSGTGELPEPVITISKGALSETKYMRLKERLNRTHSTDVFECIKVPPVPITTMGDGTIYHDEGGHMLAIVLEHPDGVLC